MGRNRILTFPHIIKISNGNFCCFNKIITHPLYIIAMVNIR